MGDHTSDSNYAAWTGDRVMLCDLGIYDRIYTGQDHRFNDRDDHDTELYLSPIFHHGICHMHPDNSMEDPPEESSGFNILSGIYSKMEPSGKDKKKARRRGDVIAQKHARDRIRQYRVLRYILTVGTLACIFMGMSGMNIPSPLLFIAAVIFVFLIRYFSRYSDQYAKEQRDLSMLVDQIERISNGELTATTDISQESAYYEYSQKLTNIGQGMEKALETQMKGERMKIDLITNVSHDLKTPLTSIIGYVDLLSRDQTLSAESRDYVTILINKTERLKAINSDLFELCEGNKVEMRKVDLERKWI